MTDSTSVPLKHHMVKKCALLAVMALEALRIIYFMVKTEAIANQLQDNIKQPITEDDRKTLRLALYIAGVVGFAYLLFMLVGVLLRHLCIVSTLVVLQILGVFAWVIDLLLKAVGADGGGYSASSNILQSVNYLSVLIGLAIAVLLYIYLRDIRQIRDEERRRAYNSVKYETA
ncbi:hypothetical protein TYRP_019532 [Tyrophagus putrescentiae]|nr:hypothetical protein TYRP_019532 [Tyrophagus putrescentiae]